MLRVCNTAHRVCLNDSNKNETKTQTRKQITEQEEKPECNKMQTRTKQKQNKMQTRMQITEQGQNTNLGKLQRK